MADKLVQTLKVMIAAITFPEVLGWTFCSLAVLAFALIAFHHPQL